MADTNLLSAADNYRCGFFLGALLIVIGSVLYIISIITKSKQKCNNGNVRRFTD